MFYSEVQEHAWHCSGLHPQMTTLRLFYLAKDGKSKGWVLSPLKRRFQVGNTTTNTAAEQTLPTSLNVGEWVTAPGMRLHDMDSW